ncbi:hypothetical protein ACFV4P_13215 [Kitasatospora sp. NPDC059795]|uniref:hypothetical protein n=1 Tax=Kitasatospora sp. NPDC059795 TaxID=3346949 RepID=UPI003665F768
MTVDMETQGSEYHTGTTEPGSARPRPGRLTPDGLIEKLNQAVRRPEAHGGVPVLPLLLDLIAEAGPQTEDALWIPDANERLSSAPFVRDHFTDPAVHVTASQYGEDAYRRGWLHLDRSLSATDHAALLDRAAVWAGTDRTLHDVLDEFGPASVTFGDPAPHLAKTLGYASSDRGAPFVVFHFAPAPGKSATVPEPVESAGAALLAVRGLPRALFGLKLTPRGRAACWPL